MNLRVREDPWHLMLAVNGAVLVGVFLYKITLPPYVPTSISWSITISDSPSAR